MISKVAPVVLIAEDVTIAFPDTDADVWASRTGPPETADVIVKVTGLLVPAEVDTAMLAPPRGAFAAMVKVAVICVLLAMTTLLTVMPVPAPTVAPEIKFVPVNVTLAAVP
jgi:hypothetical protein